MRTNFVIISPGRTGSNHLSSLLDSHGDVLCHGELFGEKNISFANENKLHLNNENFRKFLPYLFTKYHLAVDRKYNAVGFRLLLDQNQKLIKKIVVDRKIKKIFLLRRNELKRYISTKLAEQTEVWHLRYGHKKDSNEKIEFIIDDFVESRLWLERELKKYSALLEKNKQEYLVIFYEDLNKQSCTDKILTFLNLPIKQLTSTQVKLNPEELEKLVENYQDLKDHIENTNISWMLT